jgi:hypothetical protein
MNESSLSLLRYMETNKQNSVWYIKKNVVLCIVACEQGYILCHFECFVGFHARVPVIKILCICETWEEKKRFNLMWTFYFQSWTLKMYWQLLFSCAMEYAVKTNEHCICQNRRHVCLSPLLRFSIFCVFMNLNSKYMYICL